MGASLDGSSPAGSAAGSSIGSSDGSAAGSAAGSDGSSGSVGSSIDAATTKVGSVIVVGAAIADGTRPRASSSETVESGWITSRTPWSWGGLGKRRGESGENIGHREAVQRSLTRPFAESGHEVPGNLGRSVDGRRSGPSQHDVRCMPR
ncbi:MAG: hypothetical protein FJ254_08055 [Phycisphaerae bacterium]|nr:hypothetical protein [Phycisphaerae bacterium]